MTVREVVADFIRDESGQDVMEYALLASFLGVVGLLAWQGVSTGVANAYTGWDSGVQTLSKCTPDPGGGGC
jgi:Flp pilus assembly pilin Flp